MEGTLVVAHSSEMSQVGEDFLELDRDNNDDKRLRFPVVLKRGSFRLLEGAGGAGELDTSESRWIKTIVAGWAEERRLRDDDQDGDQRRRQRRAAIK